MSDGATRKRATRPPPPVKGVSSTAGTAVRTQPRRSRAPRGSGARPSRSRAAARPGAALAAAHASMRWSPSATRATGTPWRSAASAPANSNVSRTTRCGRQSSTSASVSGSAASSIRPPKPSASIRRLASAIGVSRSAACTGAQSSGSASATGAAASPAASTAPVRECWVATRTSWSAPAAACANGSMGRTWPAWPVVVKRTRTGTGRPAARAYSRIRASTSSRRVSMSACETRLSRHRRSSGSVFDSRTLKCQSS